MVMAGKQDGKSLPACHGRGWDVDWRVCFYLSKVLNFVNSFFKRNPRVIKLGGLSLLPVFSLLCRRLLRKWGDTDRREECRPSKGKEPGLVRAAGKHDEVMFAFFTILNFFILSIVVVLGSWVNIRKWKF